MTNKEGGMNQLTVVGILESDSSNGNTKIRELLATPPRVGRKNRVIYDDDLQGIEDSWASVGRYPGKNSPGRTTEETNSDSADSRNDHIKKSYDASKEHDKRPLENPVVRGALLVSLLFLAAFIALSVYIFIRLQSVPQNDPGGASSSQSNFQGSPPIYPTTSQGSYSSPPESTLTGIGQVSQPSSVPNATSNQSGVNDVNPIVTEPPTSKPTIAPTSKPTTKPTIAPTSSPTIAPTSNPTIAPTNHPTMAPTAGSTLSFSTTESPTNYPTMVPTNVLTPAPTENALEQLYMLLSLWSPESVPALQKDSSAQHRALEWMARQDGTNFTDNPQRVIQRWVLATFYFSTGGEAWSRSDDWLTSTDECSWYFNNKGNHVCNREGYLTFIELDDTNLDGKLPPELTLLSDSLVGLILNGNSIKGQFPREFEKLSKLSALGLAENSLRGNLPTEFGLLTRLEWLQLSQNEITGTIPKEIGSLEKLETLILDHNFLYSTIPTEVGKLAKLAYLSLESNLLSGTIPSEIGQLLGLQSLHVRGNYLTGEMPDEVCMNIDEQLQSIQIDCQGDLMCSCCNACL